MKHRNGSDSSVTAETPEQIIEHIGRLMDEAEAMLSGPASEATEAVTSKLSSIKDRLSAAQDKLADVYGRARKQVVAGAKYADNTIRDHPYQSIGIALGVGVLVGYLIRRNSDR